jgi:leucyl-tRNA synthetase
MGTYLFKGEEVSRELGKIGKSLKNAVSPDSIFEQFGADTLRLYEMFGGPLDQSRPWDSTAVVGMHRLLQRVWRLFIDEQTGGLLTSDTTPATDTLRKMHRTIAAVRQGMETLRFNTSIARITELCNHLTAIYPSVGMPREVGGSAHVAARPPSLPTSPRSCGCDRVMTPRSRRSHFPLADDALTHEASVEIPVTVGGKVRGRITVPAAATDRTTRTGGAGRAERCVVPRVGDRAQGRHRAGQDGQLRIGLT